MLFLAVFAGFLAEMQLEHSIERQRAKVYAANLYNELKKDTSRIDRIVERSEFVGKKLDTFNLYVTERQQRNITTGMLYYYAQFITFVTYFSPNNATIEELKGSGNLRLMKSSVAYKISEYDKKLRELEKEYSLSRMEFEKFETLFMKIFDINYLYKYYPPNSGFQRSDSAFQMQIPLINDDTRLMKELSSWLRFETWIYKEQTEEYLLPIKTVAMELLGLLEKEYHLE